MKIQIQPYRKDYTGIISDPYEKVLTLGKKTTTKGILWWKEVKEEDVWCIVGAVGENNCSVTCSVDYFWGVVRYFPYKNKPDAEKFYEEYRGDKHER